MLSRVARELRAAVQRAVGARMGQLAGEDALGNKYFLALVAGDTREQVEKRWVQFKGPPDPTQLPAEWRSWLAHSRAAPPTLEESRAIELFRGEVKRRAEILAEEEERRRFREQSLREPWEPWEEPKRG